MKIRTESEKICRSEKNKMYKYERNNMDNNTNTNSNTNTNTNNSILTTTNVHPPEREALLSTMPMAADTIIAIINTVAINSMVTADCAASETSPPALPGTLPETGRGLLEAPETPSVLGGGLDSFTAHPSCQRAEKSSRGCQRRKKG